MASLSDKYKNNLPFDSSNVTTIISDYTALNNDVVFVNTASSALTVTLPESPTAGSKIKVLDVAANSQNNIITILGNGRNIGGASAYIINTPDSSAEFLFINNAKGWNILNEYISLTKPGTPTGVSAANVGTGRAYNNGAATVSFVPSTDGDTASSYTVVSTPGSYTANGTSSPIVVTGLQSNTAYTFKVFASNAVGSSTESAASGSITATTVPQAPTISGVTYGFENVSVAFSPNATGGSAITGYTVTSNPGNVTVTGSFSPLKVSTLNGGTAYTFTATATNDNGTSTASTVSSSATPFTASGGTETISGGYRYHKFTGSSTFSLVGNQTNADILLVAGGGGGGGWSSGNGAGGGGGAGGVLFQQNRLINAGSLAVTIGGPGSAGGSNFNPSAGGNSTFDTLTANGGGYGASHFSGGQNGGSGGSGGGASEWAGAKTGGSATQASIGGATGYGNNGGNSSTFGSGGGGGAVSSGSSASGNNAGAGGAGLSNAVILDMATATSSGANSGYFAGGGAGGRGSGGAGSSGGVGGGGASSNSGTINTGGGGGGGNSGNQGTSGGSGILIVRYAI
jgi:hypothetical protein